MREDRYVFGAGLAEFEQAGRKRILLIDFILCRASVAPLGGYIVAGIRRARENRPEEQNNK